MFRNDFQGGTHVELFSVQGKDPLSKIKVCGPSAAVQKTYDKELKTFVLNIDGESSRSKVILPKSTKYSLHALQSILVFQVYIPASSQFAFEISFTDQTNAKQRLILSTSNREIVVTALHAKMPCSTIETNIWLNLCIDLSSLASGIFEGREFAVLDSIVVSANCKLKRIFTLKTRPYNNGDIPRSLVIGDDAASLQILTMETFLDAGVNIRSGTGNPSQRTPHKIRTNSPTHIAFGKRYRQNSSSENKHLDLSTNSSKSTSSLKATTPRSAAKMLDSDSPRLLKVEKVVASDNTLGDITVTDKQFILQPRPPREVAGRVRKPRVKSADLTSKEQIICDKLKGQPLSKSADTRNRRKISDTTYDYSRRCIDNAISTRLGKLDQLYLDDLSTNKHLPSLRLTKKHSKSAIDLEQSEKSISDNRDIHFKSKSLNTLPKIKPSTRYKTLENEVDQDIEDDSVFAHSEEIINNEIGDEEMVNDYLKRRTTSGFHDESSLSITSSCANSTSSELYLYSSRPRSVTGHRNSSLSNESDMEKIVKAPAKDIDKSSSSGKFDNQYTNENTECTVLHEAPDDVSRTSGDVTFIIGRPGSSSSTVDDIGDETTDMTKSGVHIDVTTAANETLNHDDKTSLSILTKVNVKQLNHLHSFKMSDSCESDSMSWLHASDDHTTSISEKNELNKDHTNLSSKVSLRKQIQERLGSFIVQDKNEVSDDGFSDCSDDTTYVEQPTKYRNYRYQDEIKSIGSTFDLSATIPATPLVGDQARYENNTTDENNNQITNIQTLRVHKSRDEELLDLLFDPVLNCYYDPVSHKYYELS